MQNYSLRAHVFLYIYGKHIGLSQIDYCRAIELAAHEPAKGLQLDRGAMQKYLKHNISNISFFAK